MSFDISTLLSAHLHTLKNQMQALLSVETELSQALESTPDAHALMEKLQGHSHSLNHRIIELLSLLKIQNQAFQPQINEHWLMDSVSLLAKEFAQLHGLTLTAQFDPDFNQFYDEQLLSIALHNACMNARQAGADSATIEIEEHDNGQWTLILNDNGPGFESQQLNQKNGHTPRGTDSGLGLYLIEQALKAHKRHHKTGSVSLHNLPLKGAQLRLMFP